MDLYGRDAPIGPIVEIQPPHPDVGVYEYLIKGRSGEFFAYEDELEPVEGFTEGIGKFNFHVGDKVKVVGRDLASRGWIGVVSSVDKSRPGLPYTVYFVGRESGEYALNELAPAKGFTEEENKTMKFNKIDEHVDYSNDVYNGFKVGDKVCWTDPETGETTCGWTIIDITDEEGMEDDWGSIPIDTIVTLENDDGSECEALLDEIEPAEGFTEEENKTMKFKKIDERIGGGDSDDEWLSEKDIIGMKVSGESRLENELNKGDDGWTTIGQPVSEAKVVVDANDVWDVLELLDNDIANIELTDLINSHLRTEEEIMDAINELCGETISKKELNTLLSGRMATLVDYLGLDVEEYENMGNFKDSDKPTSVELERSGDEIKGGEVKDGEKQVTQDGDTKTLVAGEGENKKEMSDAEAATIMGGASGTDMDAADIGVSSHEVADPYNKKPVCEMTVEQEVDDPWKLSEMLWSQGKENLEDLLRSELVGEEDIMQMLEDSELHNLTSINDAFAFDFPSILDSLGLDGEAWSQNLEFKRKGGEEPVDEAKEK